MEIEFDPRKAAVNLRKHRVSFEEAASCLLDPRALVMEDGRSEGESRWLLVGMSARARLLTVVYTLREDNPRLISARKATTKEANIYAA
ncbi:MAG: BrnT family toxin [Betaproteobacteria bacterium]|nr:BrnT family toxin [Betaproteobacteria bacterium]MSQ88439.1 BrnT family toxin [Betaproteobacteria bacterium]